IVLATQYVFMFGLNGTLVSVFSSLAHRDETVGDVSLNSTLYQSLSNARKQVTGYQTMMSAPLFFFMLFFAPRVIQLVFTAKYLPAIPVVQVGAGILLVTVAFFGGGLHVTSLSAIGKERVVFRIRLFWGIVNLIVNLPLIWFW